MFNIDLLRTEFSNCNNEQQIIEAKNKFIKTYINPIKHELATAAKEDKKEIGLKINEYTKQVEELFNEFISSFNNKETFTPTLSENDISLNLSSTDNATGHIINTTIEQIQNFFSSLNFELVNGNEVVSVDDNFERLNIPKGHPARNSQDSLFINPNTLLRTHCTSSTANVINNNTELDIRILSYGNVYRNDDDDATHSHQFTQVDIVWIHPKVTLANLKWLVDSFLKFYFGQEIQTRYRLSYFPFTEPSFEVDVSCFKCDSKGCNICKHSGWIEIMGAGMLHPNVLKQANITDKKGLAAGIGIERLIMIKYGYTDIRDLYSNLLNINKQFIK